MTPAERARQLLRRGRVTQARRVLTNAQGFEADLVRLEMLRYLEPEVADVELPPLQARAMAAAKGPNDEARTWLSVARGRYRNQRRRESEQGLREAWKLAVEPSLQGIIAVVLGRERTIQGDRSDAELWLARADAVPLDGIDAGFREHLRAMLSLYGGRHGQADVEFSGALERMADHAVGATMALRGRGRARLSLGRVEEAKADFEAALNRCQGREGMAFLQSHALNALADIAREEGDLDRAAQLFRRTLAFADRYVSWVVHLNLALTELARGDLVAAKHHVDQVPTTVARPFIRLAAVATRVAIGIRRNAPDLADDLTALEQAVALHADTDPQTMTVLEESLQSGREGGVDPTLRARIGRIVLDHALALEAASSEARAREALAEVGVALLDRFVVRRGLGEGASAQVLLADDVYSGTPIAVKVLVESALAERVARIELDAVRRLDHPGIVRIVEQGQVDATAAATCGLPLGAPWLAMELLEGGSLEGRTLDRGELAGVLHHLLRALGHAHARGVLHLDVKPANVLLDTHGLPVLVDFGIAARAGTRRGLRAASLGYAAPEQQADVRSALGPWTDLYALGATAAELLTGAAPDASGMRELPDDDLFPGLAAWIRCCLAQDPADRFQDAATAREALEALGPGPELASPRAVRGGSFGDVLHRDPRPRGRRAEQTALAAHVAEVVGARRSRRVTVGGRAGDGVSHVARQALWMAAESGRARTLWVQGDDVRGALRAQLAGMGRAGEPLGDILAGRPEVHDAAAMEAWLDGAGAVVDGLEMLLRRGPWVVVRDDPTAPWQEELPAGPLLLVDVVHDAAHADVFVPPLATPAGILAGWAPLDAPLQEMLLEQSETVGELVTTLRLLVATERLVPGAVWRTRPGPLATRDELLADWVDLRLPVPLAHALLGGGLERTWLPSKRAVDDVRQALRVLARSGLARREAGGWRLTERRLPELLRSRSAHSEATE